MGQQESEGRWPATLRNVIYAMIPKAKAQSEAQLRPIGLLPYVCCAWMAVRKDQHREWSVELHDGRHMGAATPASRTRASMGCTSTKDNITRWPS